jgi:putative acetyltransferase
MNIRDARDDDDWDLVGLVAGCWSEYPGCVLDVHGEEPELLAIASAYDAAGGRFWVGEIDGRVEASVGFVPAGRRIILKKLYVARRARRQGVGERLVTLVEDEGRARGALEVELWSDTRFDAAHRLYRRLGYERLPETRELHDLSHSVESHFRKVLS